MGRDTLMEIELTPEEEKEMARAEVEEAQAQIVWEQEKLDKVYEQLNHYEDLVSSLYMAQAYHEENIENIKERMEYYNART